MEERPFARSLAAALAAIPLLFTCGARAQQPAGLLIGMPPPKVVQTTLFTGLNSELLFRVPGEAYRGIGQYVAPGRHRIRGAVFHLADATAADGETFDVHTYLEQGSTNLPTILGPDAPGTTSVSSALGVTTPQGILEHEITVLFNPPVDVPDGSDLFVSLVFRTPGLRARTVGGTSTPGLATTLLDACGAGLDPNTAFAYLHDVGVITPLGSGLVGWQPLIELLVDGSSGLAVSRRNSNLEPTASMYSGLHPDSAAPSNQPGRADQPGYVFLANGAIGQGSPVFLLGSTMPFAGAPWIVLSPGDAVLHLSPVGLVGLGFAVVDASDRAAIFWPIPHSSAIRGLDVRSQAFGFDLATGVVAAGAATRQRF
ncbi:MAG: hypothetical protein H6838_18445 [Planctomycetes bacterium]|nr:hypothetical protein [Planctomycetota bacterium]MCB9887478.1 hypothetical protein [Planctomycetota bacterium]